MPVRVRGAGYAGWWARRADVRAAERHAIARAIDATSGDARYERETREERAEVARWQEMSSLGWNGEEIDEVSRYLQAVYYRNVRPE